VPSALNASDISSVVGSSGSSSSNNIPLIAGAVSAGVLAMFAAAGIAWFLRRKSNVAPNADFNLNAFDNQGSTNASPLYEGAAKSSFSPIYRGPAVGDSSV